jgi:predicted nucleic acid-binding Zn ribbon protein
VIEMIANMVDKVKRMMGWCPNVGAMEARKAMQFDDIVVNASDSDNELPQLTSGWLTKYRNRILLYSLILTLLAIWLFISEGINRLDVFMTGIISGLVLSLVTGVTEWRKLNKAAAGGFRRLQVTRKQMLVNYLIIIGLIVIVIFISSYFTVKTGHNIRDISAFSSGFILIVWTQFFEVVYWEWKNKKTLIVEKASFYAVDAEVEGSK